MLVFFSPCAGEYTYHILIACTFFDPGSIAHWFIMKFSSATFSFARYMGVCVCVCVCVCVYVTHIFHPTYRFQTAHIWACPPGEGDDYIFHCHPIEQKIPKPKRLVEWYRKMLDRGKQSMVVYDHKDIFRHCTDEEITMVTEIPYFEGDFWPNVIEETIKELDMEEEEERKASEAASVDVWLINIYYICTHN